MSVKAAATATKFQCFDWISLRAVERTKPNQEKPVANAQFKVISSLLPFFSCSVLCSLVRFAFSSVTFSTVLCAHIPNSVCDHWDWYVSVLKRVKQLQWRGSLIKWHISIWSVYGSDGSHLWLKFITIWCHIGHCVIHLWIKGEKNCCHCCRNWAHKAMKWCYGQHHRMVIAQMKADDNFHGFMVTTACNETGEHVLRAA